MIPRLRTGLPLFETAIVASLLGVGWALVHVYGTLDELARRKPPPPPRTEARQVARLGALISLRERYSILVEQVTDRLGAVRESLADYILERSVTTKRYFRET